MASNCKSKKTCFQCGGKHHSSICTQSRSTIDTDKKSNEGGAKGEKSYSSHDGSVVHPSALATVDGKEGRVVIDTLSSSSYVSSSLITQLMAIL